MSNNRVYAVAVVTPFGDEVFSLALPSDNSPICRAWNDKGEMVFSNIRMLDENTLECSGKTEVPFDTEVLLRINLPRENRTLDGTVFIGEHLSAYFCGRVVIDSE